MPDLTAQASTFRSRQSYSFNAYLGFVPQTAIFDRAVNMATITYPVTAITFDNAYTGAGAYTDVKEGMTVVIYNGNSSTVKGYLRVATGAASATVLQVNEFSRAYLDLTDNDKFAILDHYLMWDLLVAANATLDKDSRVTYAAQMTDLNPVANGGGCWFGFVDSGQTYATIAFDWTTSFAVDPDNVSGLTYSVDIGNGSFTVGNSTSSTCTATFPVGFRHVELTVTDADNSTTHVKQIPVYVFDRGSNTPPQVAMETLEYAAGSGFWRASFSLPADSDANITTLPDGSFICVFEDEYYGTTLGSYGDNTPTNRAHIKFCGYLVSDSISIEPESNTVTFEALGPLGVLEQIGALPQLLISDATPANWQEMQTLTIRRALWYLVYWHSTALRYFDFIWPSIPTALTYARLAVQDTSSIAGQLRNIADSIAVEVTSDRQGVIRLLKKPQFLSVAERATRGTTFNLTTADILSVDINRDHRYQTKLVTGEGITTGSSPVFSKAPGNAPGVGSGSDTLSQQIIASQTELNQRTGDHLAWLNGTYYNETTKQNIFVPKSMRLAVPDQYDWADPAHREFYSLTLASTTNGRGVSYTTSNLWTLEGVNINYDPETGTKDIDWQMRHETHGRAGTTFVPPSEALTGFPDLPDFDLTFPSLGDYSLTWPGYDFGINPAIGTIAAFSNDGYVYFTTSAADFSTPSSSGGPVWTRTQLSGLGMSGTLHGFVVDAFSPGYDSSQADQDVNGWLVTSTGIYRITDIFSDNAGIAVALQHTFSNGATNLAGRHIDASFGFPNIVAVASDYRGATNNEIEWTYTTDGSTWTEVTVTSLSVASGITEYKPGLFVSSRTAGLCYVIGFTSANGEARLYRSTDYGATWTLASPTIDLTTFTGNRDRAAAATVHVPYNDNDDTKIWLSGLDSSVGDFLLAGLLYYAKVGTNSGTNISPATGAVATIYPRGFASLGSNRQTMAFLWLRNNSSKISDLYVTQTGGATASDWTLQQSSITYNSLALVGGANSKTMYLFGYGLGYSEDLGATIDDRRGNIPTDFPGSKLFVNICGRGG